MSRTKVESVTCKVGNQNVTCSLVPGFWFSMTNTKTLKRIGCEVSRPISKKERASKFFREMTTTPIGWVTISLTFTAQTRSITTETELIVVNHEKGMDDEILLGSPWFMGLKVNDKEYLQVFKVKIVVDMSDVWVRTSLYIKSLKGVYHKNKWIRVPVSITYRELEKNDKYSVSSSDEDTDYDTDYESDLPDLSDSSFNVTIKKSLKNLKKS